MSPRRHLRIGSIPIHVEWPFFLIAALLGGSGINAWPGNRFVYILMWVAIVFVSVLVHELGHAIAYRIYGQRPSITLTAFWGLTQGQQELPRQRSVMVSLAGPLLAMVVLGAPALLLRHSVATSTNSIELYQLVYYVGFINLWWSIANLLPILPLDGGDITRTIWGLRNARVASISVGAGVAVWLFIIGQTYAAFFIAMLALMNLGEAMQEGFIGRGRGFGTGAREYERPPPPPPVPKRHKKSRRKGKKPALTVVPPVADTPRRPDPIDGARLEAAAWDALREDDPNTAEGYLLEATGRGGASPYLSASIAAARGRTVDSIGLFTRAFTASPTPPNLVVSKVIARAGIAVPLAKALLDDPTMSIDATAELQNHLHYANAFREAALVGQLVAADGRRSVAQSCYEVACSWSRAGDPAAGLDWLSKAVEAGFRAPRLIESEGDLAAVRALPAYGALASKLHPT